MRICRQAGVKYLTYSLLAQAMLVLISISLLAACSTPSTRTSPVKF